MNNYFKEWRKANSCLEKKNKKKGKWREEERCRVRLECTLNLWNSKSYDFPWVNE